MLTAKQKNNIEDNAESKRDYLLDVAENRFADQGFEAVTTRQLAAEAGVNIAMIAYYFGSKEKLFEAVIKRKLPFLQQGLIALQSNPDLSPWEQMSHTIDLYVERILEQKVFCQLILREMSLNQRATHTNLIVEIVMKNKEIIHDFIQKGIEKGFFRQVDVSMTCATLIGTVFHFVKYSAHQKLLFGCETIDAQMEEADRTRIKLHLKDMFRHHLMPSA